MSDSSVLLMFHQVLSSIAGIESAEGVLQQRASEVGAGGVWDGEVRVNSKHADNLLQLDNGVKVRNIIAYCTH